MRSVLLVAFALALVGAAAALPVASADSGVCEVSYQTCYVAQGAKCTLQHDDPYRVLIDCWNFIGP